MSILEGVRGPNIADSRRRATAIRKIACRLCRQRKKKCDGATPSCSGCIKLRAACQYEEQQQPVFTASTTPSLYGSLANHANTITSPSTAEDEGSTWDWNLGFDTSAPKDASFVQNQATTQTNPLSILSDPNPWPDMNMSTLGEDNMLVLGMDFDHLDYLRQPASSVAPPNYSSPPLEIEGPSQARPLEKADMFVSDATSPMIASTSKPAVIPSAGPPENNFTEAPLQPVLKELLDIFFQQYHALLPCVHQQSLLRQLEDDSLNLENDALPFAIASIAARAHLNPSIAQSSPIWLATASALFDKSVKTLAHPLHTLTASVWIVFHLFIVARMSEMWVFLGKACRLVSLLGLDRIDSTGRISPFASPPQSPLEVEQRRQVVWALYLLDRLLSALCGWPLALDDRHFMVHFPREDGNFQKCDLSSENEPFTTDMSLLVRPASEPQGTKHASMTMLRKTCVLLGQILTYNNTIHATCTISRAAQFTALEDALGRFCLTYSRDAQAMWNVKAEDLDLTIWLEVTLQMCNVLLYHPTATAAHSAAASSSGAHPKRSRRTSSQALGNEDNSGLHRCLNATHNMVLLVRKTASRGVKPLLNPFLVPAYFLSCRFLIIGWHEQNDSQFRQDLEVMLMLVNRAVQAWGPLGLKYRASILQDIQRSRDEALGLRVGTGSYLQEGCAG